MIGNIIIPKYDFFLNSSTQTGASQCPTKLHTNTMKVYNTALKNQDDNKWKAHQSAHQLDVHHY